MSVPSEPFVAVYEDRNRLGVIVARTGRGGLRLSRPTITAWDGRCRDHHYTPVGRPTDRGRFMPGVSHVS
jgi:hypothetical protein